MIWKCHWVRKGPASLLQPTRGEVDVGEQDDVGGHEGDELGDADLLLEVHVDQALSPQAAVGAGVQEHQAGPQAAQEPGHRAGRGGRGCPSWSRGHRHSQERGPQSLPPPGLERAPLQRVSAAPARPACRSEGRRPCRDNRRRSWDPTLAGAARQGSEATGVKGKQLVSTAHQRRAGHQDTTCQPSLCPLGWTLLLQSKGHRHFSREPGHCTVPGTLGTPSRTETVTHSPGQSTAPRALLGMVAPEDQGDGVGGHPLPGVQAHPAVLPGDAEQQVCGQKAAGAGQSPRAPPAATLGHEGSPPDLPEHPPERAWPPTDTLTGTSGRQPRRYL